MSEIKLLPCPFCGEELEVVGKGHYYAHKINGCILQHLCFETDDKEGIERWNTRKPMKLIIEQLEEMESKPTELCYDVPLINSIIDIVKRNGGKE